MGQAFWRAMVSESGVNFKTVGTMTAVNSRRINHYEFTHLPSSKGKHYYRLQQLDFDGKYEYSEVVAVQLGQSAEVVIYPNPAQNVLFVNWENQEATPLELYNAFGALVREFTPSSQLDLTGLAEGIYILKSENGVLNERVVLSNL